MYSPCAECIFNLYPNYDSCYGSFVRYKAYVSQELEMGFSCTVKLPYFIAEAQIAKPPAPELVSHFLKYFSSCKESLVLQY